MNLTDFFILEKTPLSSPSLLPYVTERKLVESNLVDKSTGSSSVPGELRKSTSKIKRAGRPSPNLITLTMGHHLLLLTV